MAAPKSEPSRPVARHLHAFIPVVRASGGSEREGKRGGCDMEVQRARFLSLALEFGFDEAAANRCLDRLLDLYGEIFCRTLVFNPPSIRCLFLPVLRRFGSYLLTSEAELLTQSDPLFVSFLFPLARSLVTLA